MTRDVTIEQIEAFEDAIFDAQSKLIKKECGAKAAREANYGWGVDCVDDLVYVSTKIYGHGVLTSCGCYTDHSITHEWA